MYKDNDKNQASIKKSLSTMSNLHANYRLET